MNCLTPMIRYYLDKNLLPAELKAKADNKEIKLYQKIIPRHEVLQKLEKDENLITHLERRNQELEKQGSLYRYQAIPCGHCISCQLKYSAEWATRIICECEKSENNYFLTITYNEENLPLYEKFGEYENDGTWTGSLQPKDINKFLNTLRKNYELKGHKGIKYFYCGEYGNAPTQEGKMGYRPHYHMILMNCPLDITQFYDFHLDTKTKKIHWKSKEIDKIWKKGLIDIGEVEWSSAAYVARYCMKKISYEKDKTIYYSHGKLPEFVRMSRRPGIGAEYFNKNINELIKTDKLIMKNFHGQTATYKPPKAWDRKMEKLYPKEWEKIKISRQEAAKRAAKIKRELSNATDLERLESQAENILIKSNQLPRSNDFDY